MSDEAVDLVQTAPGIYGLKPISPYSQGGWPEFFRSIMVLAIGLPLVCLADWLFG